jgi:LDH2 family malate/lactate/ureidoglycolate dehydrogenase
LVDEDGQPTTDPSQYPEKGALLPMAMHKGYGLAVLVETLCAALTGAAMMSQIHSWVFDDPTPPNQGHAFIAIDIPAMMPAATFKARMDRMTREIKATPRGKGVERIYLPGEMEWERQEAANARGMHLPDTVIANLLGLAEDVGMVSDLEAIFY